MKSVRIFILFLFFSTSLFSQKEKDLIGDWSITKIDRKKNVITLIKRENQTYGSWYILKRDKTIRQAYSAPCGNDSGFFRAAAKGVGKWNFDEESKIFTSSILLYKYKNFKVVKFTGTTLVLIPKNKI